jgi:hypothetical protein
MLLQITRKVQLPGVVEELCPKNNYREESYLPKTVANYSAVRIDVSSEFVNFF